MQETRTAMHAVTEIQKHWSSGFQLFPSPPTARIWLLVFKWHKTSFFFGLGISEDRGSEIFALSVNSPAAYQGCFKTEISKSKGQMCYVSLHNMWQGTGQGTVFAGSYSHPAGCPPFSSAELSPTSWGQTKTPSENVRRSFKTKKSFAEPCKTHTLAQQGRRSSWMRWSHLCSQLQLTELFCCKHHEVLWLLLPLRFNNSPTTRTAPAIKPGGGPLTETTETYFSCPSKMKRRTKILSIHMAPKFKTSHLEESNTPE